VTEVSVGLMLVILIDDAVGDVGNSAIRLLLLSRCDSLLV
jgi:hypothetical protein